MKKLMWTISFICLAATAVVIQFFPESIPMHHNSAGIIDRWGSKYESFIFPIIILAASLHWTLFIRHYEKKARTAADEKTRAEAGSNVKVLEIVGVSMAAMFTVMQGFVLYGAYTGAVSGAEKQTVDIGRVSVILMGLMFIIAGNFLTKTRINGTVGLRLSWSMYNDNTWRKSNRFGAIAIMVAGVLTIITGAAMKSSFAATMIALGYVLAAVILCVVYAYRVYRAELGK